MSENKRNIKKMWKDGAAVSPVIGTILMVAITVVLAAVVIAVIPSGGPGHQPPIVGMGSDMRDGNWIVKIYNLQHGPVHIGDTSVQIVNESSGAAVVRYPKSGTGIGSGDGANFDFNDNDANNRIDAGDSFLVYQNQNVTSGYKFKIFKATDLIGEARLI